jgi:hypothetical protein
MRVGFNVGPNYFGDLLDVGMEGVRLPLLPSESDILSTLPPTGGQ